MADLYIRDDPRRAPGQWTEVADRDDEQTVALFRTRDAAEAFVVLFEAAERARAALKGNE